MTPDEWETRPRGPIPEKRRAKCRHCGRAIFIIQAGWTDTDGLLACIKGALKRPDYPGQPGGAIARRAVLHEPMPEGLVGAPS